MSFFNRKAEVIFQSAGETLHVVKDLRIQFEIEKYASNIDNRGIIRITNLNPTVQKQISRIRLKIGEGPYITMFLKVGYGDDLRLLFRGAIIRAVNHRQGADWITEIEGFTAIGQFASTTVPEDFTFENTPALTIMSKLFDLLGWGEPKVSPEAQEILDKNTKEQQSFAGLANRALTGYLKQLGLDYSIDEGGPSVFVDRGVIDSDKVDSALEVISKENGLVETPRITDTGAQIQTLIRPEIAPLNRFVLRADTLTRSGPENANEHQFSARTVKHNGDTRGEDWRTEIEAVFYPEFTLGRVSQYGEEPEQYVQ